MEEFLGPAILGDESHQGRLSASRLAVNPEQPLVLILKPVEEGGFVRIEGPFKCLGRVVFYCGEPAIQLFCAEST